MEQEPQQPEAPQQDAAPSVEASPPPPPPPVTPATHGRLTRRPEGKLIAGVCTGLGAYTGIDPVAWRIGFVVLGLTTGIGLIAYIVAWLVMPMAHEGEPVPHVTRELNAGRWVGIAALALGVLLFAHQAFGFHTSWFWGVLLIGLGLALWGRDWSGSHRPPPPERRTDMSTTEPPVPPTQTPPAPPAATASFATATQPLPPTPRTPKPKKPPSILGRLVIGACALAIGATLLLSNLNVFHASPKFVLALLVAIIGAGLLVGTLWGRARWLIFPGVALALMLATVAAIPFNTRGGFGPAVYRPDSFTALRHTYEHGAGPMQLDLTRLAWGGHHRSVNARLGAGPMIVIVPKDINVIVHGHTQAGPLDLFGHGSAGWDVSDTVESKVKDAKAVLRLNADVTFGPLLVDREGSAAAKQFLSHQIHGRN